MTSDDQMNDERTETPDSPPPPDGPAAGAPSGVAAPPGASLNTTLQALHRMRAPDGPIRSEESRNRVWHEGQVMIIAHAGGDGERTTVCP